MHRSCVVRLEMYVSTVTLAPWALLGSGSEIATEADDSSVDRKDRGAMKQRRTTDRGGLQ